MSHEVYFNEEQKNKPMYMGGKSGCYYIVFVIIVFTILLLGLQK